MGVLEELGTARRFTLGARCLIGRHPGCDLRLQDPRVSSEHAVVRWLDGGWELRDLGSRNRTFLQGRRLDPGERAPLVAGVVFTLGAPEVGFTLADAAPPVPAARHRKTGAVQTAADHVLALPDEERPIVTLFEDPAGRWVIERDEGTELVADHDLVVVDGEPWIVELPAGIRATWEASAGPVLEAIALRFAVSRDEEHVEVTVLHDGRELPLPPRSYHYLLLTLARQRLGDAGASPGERGWVDRDALCQMLSTEPLKLNVDICRARKQLGALGVAGAAGIVERRPTSGQVRLGIDRIELTSL